MPNAPPIPLVLPPKNLSFPIHRIQPTVIARELAYAAKYGFVTFILLKNHKKILFIRNEIASIISNATIRNNPNAIIENYITKGKLCNV
jgi:hypothetical protein